MVVKAIELELDSPLLTKIFNPNEKIAVTIDLDSFNILKSTFGEMPRKINLELFNIVKGIGVYQNNHVYWLMEETMRKIIPAGIPQYIRKFVYNFFVKHAENPKRKIPKVLKLDDLKVGFILWLVACFVSFFVFLLELIWIHGKSAIGLFFILKFLKRFTRRFY